MDFGFGGMFIMNGDHEFTIKITGLSDVQSARVFALQQARAVLVAEDQTDTVVLGNAKREWVKPGNAPDVMDIYNLSLFILDGVDPWLEARTAPTPFRVAAVADQGAPDEELPGFD